MPVGRKYSMHRRVLEELKYQQLDVYRFKDYDALRLRLPDGKIVVASLEKHREDYADPEEFREAVKKAVKEALEKEKMEKERKEKQKQQKQREEKS